MNMAVCSQKILQIPREGIQVYLLHKSHLIKSIYSILKFSMYLNPPGFLMNNEAVP